jgi:Flp pilus assembly protein TadG
MRLASRGRQQGAMLITASLWLILLIALAALAFDVGHLMVVRNELQNAADGAALAGANCLDKATAGSGTDCTQTPSPTLNWAIAGTKATNSIGLNKSDSVSLATGTVQTGYWNVNGGTALQPTTLSPLGPCTVVAGVMTTECHKPAVMVMLGRTAGSNGGPVGTLIATMFNGTAIPISARAVAVLSSPGNVMPGTLIPQAINKCMFDLYWDSATNSPKLATTTTLNGVPQVIGQPWQIRIGSSYHYGTCESGQWTSFKMDVNDVPTVRDLINNGNPDPLGIGDDTWIEPGTKSSVYDTLSAKYPTPPGANVTVAVVDQPSGWSTNTQAPIVAFAGFHIDAINKSDKYIEGHFVKGVITSGSSGIGPYYGTYTPPRLAQ